MMIVGSCQVYSGVGKLGTRGYLPMPAEETAEAAEALRNVVAILDQDPHQRALGVVAIVGGVLLFLMSLRLLRRVPGSVWWAKQAMVANVLVSGGTCFRHAMHLLERSPDLVTEARTYAAASDGLTSSQVMDMIWVQLLLPEVLYGVFLIYLLWRLTRSARRAAAEPEN
tara:strand:- start:4100 stop:4606 length:507 start_codon:yes stop_codon:yes gene_type:complete